MKKKWGKENKVKNSKSLLRKENLILLNYEKFE